MGRGGSRRTQVRHLRLPLQLTSRCPRCDLLITAPRSGFVLSASCRDGGEEGGLGWALRQPKSCERKQTQAWTWQLLPVGRSCRSHPGHEGSARGLRVPSPCLRFQNELPPRVNADRVERHVPAGGRRGGTALCGAVQGGTAPCGTVHQGMARRGTARHDAARHDEARRAWHRATWRGANRQPAHTEPGAADLKGRSTPPAKPPAPK